MKQWTSYEKAINVKKTKAKSSLNCQDLCQSDKVVEHMTGYYDAGVWQYEGRIESGKLKDEYLKNTSDKFWKWFCDKYIYLFMHLWLSKITRKKIWEKSYGNTSTIKAVLLDVQGKC